ncbi:MAG TPA: ABC transporter substrate-binding protein, partial [Stellaceae bacterium]|nr:ABC transporter substrate-binding protein [Stellaceae bacterium]
MRVREIGNSILAGAFALLCLPISVAPTVARAAEDVTCQLDWLPSGGKAPVFIGVVKGFFAEDGLNVTVKSSRGAGDAIIRAATGTADFATGDMGTLLNARAQGAVPVKAFFSVYTKLPDSVITVKGNGITTIKDLVGKTVGNAPFGGEDALWAAVLSLNGIDPKSVKMVSLDPKVHGPMLASGKVDALIDWATGAP